MTNKKLFEEQYAEIFGVQPALYACTFEIKDSEYVLLSVGKAFKLWQASAKREGFKLAPKKCTNNMAHAAKSVDARLSVFKYSDVWDAMLSAVEEE